MLYILQYTQEILENVYPTYSSIIKIKRQNTKLDEILFQANAKNKSQAELKLKEQEQKI